MRLQQLEIQRHHATSNAQMSLRAGVNFEWRRDRGSNRQRLRRSALVHAPLVIPWASRPGKVALPVAGPHCSLLHQVSARLLAIQATSATPASSSLSMPLLCRTTAGVTLWAARGVSTTPSATPEQPCLHAARGLSCCSAARCEQRHAQRRCFSGSRRPTGPPSEGQSTDRHPATLPLPPFVLLVSVRSAPSTPSSPQPSPQRRL